MSKSLIFTDIHFGINSDKPSRQKIAEAVVDEITSVCEVNSIKTIFFLGDLFHHRTSIEVSTLNLADRAIRKLSSVAELYLIQGNHDLYEKSGHSLSSTGIFTDNNIKVIASPTELTLNGQSVLLMPWCGDGGAQTMRDFMETSNFKPSTNQYDILMGHFNVTDGSDLERANARVRSKFLNRNETGVGGLFDSSSRSELVNCSNQAEELFALTHSGSNVYMGHVHEHQELILSTRLFHIVGSPQMQTHDLKGIDPNRKRHGYYILDDENKPQFIECRSAPKFVTVYASEIKNPTKDTLDKLKSLKGCIVKRCYDCALTEKEKRTFDKAVTAGDVLEEDSAVFTQGRDSDDNEAKETSGLSETASYTVSCEEFLKEMSSKILLEDEMTKTMPSEQMNREATIIHEILKRYHAAVSN